MSKNRKKPKLQKTADEFVHVQWGQRIPTLEVETKTWESFIATDNGKEVCTLASLLLKVEQARCISSSCKQGNFTCVALCKARMYALKL